MGETAIRKNGAKKVRKIYKNTVVSGFAGSVADAFSLTEKFEKKLEEHSGNLKRAAVDLAQLGRSDKGMRNLEALMIVADKNEMLIISGNGEVIEPDQDFVAIGSGGNYAYAAANALYNHTDTVSYTHLDVYKRQILHIIPQFFVSVRRDRYHSLKKQRYSFY